MTQSPTDQSGHLVRDIMTAPVHTADMDDSLLNVRRLFEREQCHHVVIMKHRRAHGVVSDRDILKVLSPFVGCTMMERSQDLHTLKKRVHQVMSRNLVTIKPEETIKAAAEKILQERVSCLPVVGDNESVVGIVTVRDFVKWSLGIAEATGTQPIDPDQDGGDPDQDEGVLVIIDGNRCYMPDARMARLIRKAEDLYDTKHGVGSVRVNRLPAVSICDDLAFPR